MTNEELQAILRGGATVTDEGVQELATEVERLRVNYENAVTSGIAAVNYGIQREAALRAEVESLQANLAVNAATTQAVIKGLRAQISIANAALHQEYAEVERLNKALADAEARNERLIAQT